MRHIFPLAIAALAGTALTCVRLADAPELICRSSTDCAAGQKCRFSTCVPADLCSDLSECAPSESCIGGHCVAGQCTSADSAVCGDYACGSNRTCLTFCGVNVDCRSGLVCVSGSCRAPMDAGVTDTRVTDAATTDTGTTEPRDASTAGALNSACNLDSDCQSRHCCAAANAPARLCRTACPAITGDYCIGICSESGAFCDGPTNFSTDGFCSRSCGGGCGNNSAGRANVCIMLTAGSSPSSACKPGCDTTADCRAIHASLTCWIGFSGKKACDFSTDTWGPNE